MTPERKSSPGQKPAIPDEVYLRRRREMSLITTGRRTGRPHRVGLWFAAEPGRICLMAYARRHGRGTDWYQNLQRHGSALVEVGERRYQATLEAIADPDAALTRITELFGEKYGRQMVNSYYTGTKRYPVCLAIVPAS